MPYTSVSDLPSRITDSLDSEAKQRQWLTVFNSVFDRTQSDAQASAAAWSAVDKMNPTIADVHVAGGRKEREKRQVSEDVFTTEGEARSRSFDLGLGGAVHVHEDADGQVRFMPGDSHSSYVAAMAGMVDNPVNSEPARESVPDSMPLGGGTGDVVQGLRALLAALVPPRPEVVEVESADWSVESEVLKMDDEARMVWGWASVITEDGEPVVDSQGDMISPEELVRATTEYMIESRVGKAMHEGDPTSVTVHSFPMTYEISKAFGFETGREGWLIAQKVFDDDVWTAIKAGDMPAFSIGGSAKPVEVPGA